MHVGIIVPAFNVAPWVGEAVKSVLQQSVRDWTLVVVDDGSTDATADIVATFHDPRIRLVRQANSGVSAARNRGLASVEADAILFLDGDDWLAPDALAVLTGALAGCPRAVAAAGGYARTGMGGPLRPVTPTRSAMLLHRILVQNPFANGGHLLIRSDAIQAAGPFDLGLTYGEDWEYWTRLAAIGAFEPTGTPEPLLFVRERPGSAYRSMASDPVNFGPCLDKVYSNPAILARIGQRRLAALRRRAEAENAWVIGRELIRHLRGTEGRAWLARSLRRSPGFKRFGLLGLSWLGKGPFQPYRT